ncbi:hypothetical protein UlMin_016421 [Ulmus minor]
MSVSQISACQPPTICARIVPESQQQGLKPSSLAFHGGKVFWTSLKICSSRAPIGRNCLPMLKYRKLAPVCLSKTGGDNEGSPWKAFENVLGNFGKGKSVEDVLRQQMEKKDFVEDRDNGGKPPRGGGGGGGGGGDSLGGSDDEGLSGIMDETFQVILATLGFILLYIYIINGEELAKLLKDYLKYVFKGSESVRLRRAMNVWGRFYRKMTEKKVQDKYWLEKAIISTPTWYDSPEKYRRIFRSNDESRLAASYDKPGSAGSYDESNSAETYEESDSDE